MMNKTNKKAAQNIHAGHRERLRTRYRNCGFDDFHEHEVLELLLFYARPRADTNPIAHNLLNHFGSLYNVMRADYDALCEVEGVGPATAALIRTAADSARAAKLKQIGATPLTSIDRLYIYATEWFFGKPHGTVAILLLDRSRKVITVRTLADEHLRRPDSYHEEILRLCQKMDAASVVLMHNHVSGVMHPSDEDIVLTREIYAFLTENDIALLEHLIVHEMDCIRILDTAMRKEVSGFPKS